ncbi:MAG: hypothetical protein OEW94_09855 [Betaproteobacteria bacterium]|nr:hypothetical protein [Betaproteobacteria bacterium]
MAQAINTAQLALRLIGIAAIPPILTVAVLVLAWPLIYVVNPLFLPFCAYEFSCSSIGVHGAPTPFHDNCRIWSAAFVLGEAGATTWVTRRYNVGIAVAALLPVALASALAIHLLLYLLGFCYWLDMP